jgi:hypothetical protein
MSLKFHRFDNDGDGYHPSRSGACCTVLTAMVSIVTLILLSVTVSVARTALVDAGATLADVQALVPEVNGSLEILRRLCASDILRGYC